MPAAKSGIIENCLGRNLLQGMLTFDPKERLPIDPAMLPTWPAKSEIGSRNEHAAHSNSSKPPSHDGQYEMQAAVDVANVDVDCGFILRANRNSKVRQMAMGSGFTLKF